MSTCAEVSLCFGVFVRLKHGLRVEAAACACVFFRRALHHGDLTSVVAQASAVVERMPLIEGHGFMGMMARDSKALFDTTWLGKKLQRPFARLRGKVAGERDSDGLGGLQGAARLSAANALR